MREPGLDGRTGDGGRVYQAARDINSSTSTHVRVSGWAVLAAVVAVAAGAVGVYGLTAERSERGSGPITPLSSVSPSAQDTAAGGAFGQPGITADPGVPSSAGTPTGSPGGAAREASSGSAEQWQGTLAVSAEGGKELDGGHPVQSSASSLAGPDISVGTLGDGMRAFTGSGAIELWKGSGGEPGEAACAETADAGGEPYGVKLRQGTVLCLRTDEGRVARLKVTRLPQDFMSAVEFEAVVWKAADGQGG
ncbi:hypothetical protein [Streptomyces sp. NPDC021356]|uniref:hypothetical protein n=1 Tax=Streptomyces sp. NPDC021356 TaxID=3154900 RepID=UPI0033F3E675